MLLASLGKNSAFDCIAASHPSFLNSSQEHDLKRFTLPTNPEVLSFAFAFFYEVRQKKYKKFISSSFQRNNIKGRLRQRNLNFTLLYLKNKKWEVNLIKDQQWKKGQRDQERARAEEKNVREIEVHRRAPLALEDLEGCCKNRAGHKQRAWSCVLWDMLQCVKHSIYNFIILSQNHRMMEVS